MRPRRNEGTKSGQDTVKDAIHRSKDEDPLGANTDSEQHRLKLKISRLTVQCKDLQQRNNQLEKASVDAKALKDLLSDTEEQLQRTKEANEDLALQLRSIREEFQRFRKQSELNAEDYEHRVETLSEQLHHQLKSKHGQSRSLLDTFPENCDQPFPVQHPPVNEDTHSTDVEYSVGHDSNADEMEEYHKKIYQLTQSLRSMGMKQKDLQRRLAEAQDERDYLKSIKEDLQQQVDASSPEASSHLRAMVQSLEAEITRLATENEALKLKSRIRSTTDGDDESEIGGSMQQKFSYSDVKGLSARKKTEDGPSELSEELMDCSMDIMGELANATSDREIGLSMTYVQYAGLLSAVQKAIKHFEQSKQSFDPSQSLRVLDSSLSQSLSISRFRVRAPDGAGEKRLDELLMIVKEKESELHFMVDMIADLRQEIKGRQSLTLQQEVQLEYLKQQLSSSDKVISLTWEVEGLKKVLEESQRELKAQRDLNEQQQQELTIQWQSKQQAVAETLSQTHRVSSFSQQLEHVVEANEALEAEKQELEEALEESRGETAQLNQQYVVAVQELYQQRERLVSRLAHEPRQNANGELDRLESILEILGDVDASLQSFKLQWNRIGDTKQELLQKIKGINNDCIDWKTDVVQREEENLALKQEIEVQKEARVKSEALRVRAEQEKLGVQEILSLTSETTSNEIMHLQRQLSGATHELDKEKTELTSTNEKLSELQSTIRQLEAVNEEEKQGRLRDRQSLEEKLQTCNQEKTNLETRVRSYKDVIAGLNRDMTSCEGRIKELDRVNEQRSSSLRLEAEKTEALEQKLKASVKESADAQELIADLRERCSESERLKKDVDRLSDEKSELESRLDRSRHDLEDVQCHYNQAVDQTNNLKLKNSELSQEQRRLQDKLNEQQQALINARAEWESEIAALSEMDVPKERWPPSVLTLVQKWQDRTQDAVEDDYEQKMKTLEARIVEIGNQNEQQTAEYQEELVECGVELRSLQDTVDNLQSEMKERESKLQSEIKEAKSKMQAAVNRLEAELWEMTDQHETLQSESEATIQQMKTEADHKDVQLTDVQAKARELMKEKDAEIERLKKASLDGSLRSFAPDSRSEIVPTNVHQLQSEINSLKHQINRLVDSLADSERTFELQTEAHRVLKDELNAYKRSEKRGSLDMNYVKNVLVSAFETGSLPKTSPMLIVLARLFEFDEEEMTRINKAESPSERRLTSTGSGSMFSWMRP